MPPPFFATGPAGEALAIDRVLIASHAHQEVIQDLSAAQSLAHTPITLYPELRFNS
jgi:hypothetical protein